VEVRLRKIPLDLVYVLSNIHFSSSAWMLLWCVGPLRSYISTMTSHLSTISIFTTISFARFECGSDEDGGMPAFRLFEFL
jgi:hypothetical protein